MAPHPSSPVEVLLPIAFNSAFVIGSHQLCIDFRGYGLAPSLKGFIGLPLRPITPTNAIERLGRVSIQFIKDACELLQRLIITARVK